MGSRTVLALKMAVFGRELQLLKPRPAICDSRSWLLLWSFLLNVCVVVRHIIHETFNQIRSSTAELGFFPISSVLLLATRPTRQ